MKPFAPIACVAIVSLSPGFAAARQSACSPSWVPTFGTDLGKVHALAVFDDGSGPALYAGGQFTSMGGVQANAIARWDGAHWSPVGEGVIGAGVPGSVHSLLVFDNGTGPALYAGGIFDPYSIPKYLKRWDGVSWVPIGNIGGVGFFWREGVWSLGTFDDGNGPALYVGGTFEVGFWPDYNIARLTPGNGLAALPFSVGSAGDGVHALKAFDDGSGPALFMGRTEYNTTIPAQILKWDGSTPPSIFDVDGGWGVYALEVFDDGTGPALYAGGQFTSVGGQPFDNVARWDGSSWTAVGGGVDKAITALAVFDDGSGAALYAAGVFTLAGGSAAERIAKWDGSRWYALGANGSGMSAGPLYSFPGGGFQLFESSALGVFDDGTGPALFAGGNFTTSVTGDAYLAKWGCSSLFTTFCTAKTTTVCGPANVSATGTPSATASSGFRIKAQPVRGCRSGLLLYSNQPTVTGTPFGGPGDGNLCLLGTGLRRAGPIQTGSSPNLCEATFAIDMNRFNTNTWAATGCNPPPGQTNPAGFLSNMGTTVNAQMWGRDSIATGQVLSDGISWVVRP